jgi:hypothetical protein
MAMTALALPESVAPVFDPRIILGLGLPAHVLVRLDDGWTSAWLIGRPQCADGWVALVQCVDATGREQTLRLAPDRVTVANLS